MAFDPDRLRNWDFGEKRQSYEARDAILYALGVGLPFAAGDNGDLRFLLEDRLSVLPSFAVTLATPGLWPKQPALEIDWVKLLHTAHAATFHVPLPQTALVSSRARIASLHDRGADKGAVCVLRREVRDQSDGRLYCTIDQTLALRGNGGFGGDPAPRAERSDLPKRAPDVVETVATSARAALIYRLSGDYNPLHADYDVARKAGFERPILHGLASYGTACAVVLRAFCDGDPAGMRSLDVRFSGLVLPGDRLTFSLWKEGRNVRFNAACGEKIVLDQGIAQLA